MSRTLDALLQAWRSQRFERDDDASDFPRSAMPRNAHITEDDAAEAAATICRFA